MNAPVDTVPDTTDPGTLRPNLKPEAKQGTHFEPMFCPPFDKKINLPNGIIPLDAFGIWSQFFPPEQLQLIVDHTNQYEPKPQPGRPQNWGARKWQPLTLRELYIFFAIWIYMGIYYESQIRYYWRQKEGFADYFTVYKAMSLNQWEDISVRLYLAALRSGNVYSMVEPLNSYIMDTSTKLWTPSRDVAVDESIERFKGRSYDTLIIPNKPISEGYKIWGIAQEGHMLH